MARKATSLPEPPKPKPVFSTAQIERGLGRLDERILELQDFNIGQIPSGNSPALQALEAAIEDTITRCFGEDTAASRRFLPAASLQFHPMAFGGNYPQQHHYQQYAQENIARSVALLGEAKRVLHEDLSEIGAELQPSEQRHELPTPSHRVFVVHGHDEAALQGLARFLEQLGLEATILREQPDQGRTIIEKFEACAAEVGFAVVLLTPDDIGSAVSAQDQMRRARQNVIFELGYFAGKLGRGRACLLRKGQVEIPSDLYGVIYTEMDEADGWKLKLVRELKAAKLDFDANRMWG